MTTSRSESLARYRAALLGLSLAAATGAASPGLPEAEPTGPPNGAVVGARPVFHVALPGLGDEELRDARLRIHVESEVIGGRSFVHDQRRRAAGWARGEQSELLFRPPRPIPDGPYAWRVEIWDGATWIERGSRVRFRVDTVPPADVENLRATRDDERGVVLLEWDPVTLDAAGGAEYVALYHVYRYPRASDSQVVRVFEVAQTEGTRVELPYGPDDPEQGRWFLRVTAEDQAGNVAHRPE